MCFIFSKGISFLKVYIRVNTYLLVMGCCSHLWVDYLEYHEGRKVKVH